MLHLAGLAERTVATLRSWETGATCPTVSEAEELARHLGVEAWLMLFA